VGINGLEAILSCKTILKFVLSFIPGMDAAYLERLIKDDNDVEFVEKWLVRKKRSLSRQRQRTQSKVLPNEGNNFSKASFSLSWEVRRFEFYF